MHLLGILQNIFWRMRAKNSVGISVNIIFWVTLFDELYKLPNNHVKSFSFIKNLPFESPKDQS
jgi:hypothetical protein